MFTTIRYTVRDMPLGKAGIRIMKSATATVFLTMTFLTVTTAASTVAGGIDTVIRAIGENPVGLILWVVFAAVMGNLWTFFDELEEESRARANRARYAGKMVRKR